MDSTNTVADLINESREVLYGETKECVTLENVYQLMVGMNERLTTIEKGMLQVTQINRTLTTMVHNFGELKTKVSNVESDVNKLKSKSATTESDIASIKNKNVNIDRDMKQMKKDNSETNRNMQGLSDFIDDFRAKHESNVKEVSGIRTAMSKAVNDFEDMSHELKQEIKVSINEVKEENDELKDTIIDLQCRSMKNNLIFTGLREPENENTENLIRGFIKDELHIYHKLELGNVHRFGTGAQPGKRGRPRPIVARFIYHNDLAMVMSNTYRLKGKQYGVNKQFPEAIEQARKSLYPVMKEMKADGHRVRLVRDILYVDGVIYNHQTLNSPSPNNRRELLNTPEDYQSRKRRRRESRNSTDHS
ncbi:unnamed protein product [Mytilus edulis]|uniref:Uncharacterized protein n=1 Tax=Mytilus edulis TaxID=6550 RepID=A0A8S3RRK6_MYTED|nr:unnamed protein product [Mytilus edulis]